MTAVRETKPEGKQITSRKQQALRTRTKIIDTVMKHGDKHGFETLKIADVCKAAGISVGTFYHYFPSLEAVLQEQYIAYDEFISQAIKDVPLMGSAPNQLLQLFVLKYEYVSERGVQFIVRQYSGQFRQIDTSNSIFFSEERVMYKTLLSILKAGIQNGEFVLSSSPEHFANALLILSRGLTIDWALKNGSYDLKTEALEYLKFMLLGVCVSAEKSRNTKNT